MNFRPSEGLIIKMSVQWIYIFYEMLKNVKLRSEWLFKHGPGPFSRQKYGSYCVLPYLKATEFVLHRKGIYKIFPFL
jgi:hypothetical protein